MKNIIYQEEKADLIKKLGVDYLFNIEFTKEIMTTPTEEYVKKFLVDMFNAKEVFCGFNHRFGHKAAGNDEMLKELGQKYGFGVN